MRRAWFWGAIAPCAILIVLTVLGHGAFRRVDRIVEADGRRIVTYRYWGGFERTKVEPAPVLSVSEDFRAELRRRGVVLRPQEERLAARVTRTSDGTYATYTVPLARSARKGAVAYYQTQIPSPVRRVAAGSDQVSGQCRDPKAVLTVVEIDQPAQGVNLAELTFACRREP